MTVFASSSRVPADRARQTGTTVDVYSRVEFLQLFKQSYDNEHVVAIGPTGRGKTYLCLQMLGEIVAENHKALILAGKPPKRDKTMTAAADQLHLRVTDRWPPTPNPLQRNRKNGWVLRPAHTMEDLKADDENIQKQFRNALVWAYNSDGPTIVFADEAFQLQNKPIELQREYETILVRGRPHVAMWSLLQRGRYSSLFTYDNSDHILIGYDPDKDNVDRYARMIGGIPPKLIAEIVSHLKTKRIQGGGTISEFLYVNRADNKMLVVSTD